MRPDPRIRQSLNRISTTIETATDTARTGCFTFAKSYLDPCLATISECFPRRRTHHHRRVPREYPFGFYDYDYDDGDDDEGRGGRGGGSSGGFLAWRNDELDRLLAGSGSGYVTDSGAMYYGASSSSGAAPTSSAGVGGAAGKRKSLPAEADPTVIPQTSMFGFLARFAGFRGRALRYRPSAANLQEHPQRHAGLPVLEEDVSSLGSPRRGSSNGGSRHRRNRSATGSSGESAGGSLRSRGDLWPSEDDDDAIPIGDDFLRSPDEVEQQDRNFPPTAAAAREDPDAALRMEEEAEAARQEAEVQRKREAAKRLAVQKGLAAAHSPPTTTADTRSLKEPADSREISQEPPLSPTSADKKEKDLPPPPLPLPLPATTEISEPGAEGI